MITFTTKQEKAFKEGIIRDYLEGDLKTFLKKHWKQYCNQLIYSTYIRKWKKQKETKRLAISLLKSISVPRNICGIVNIMITLEKHYDYKLNESCALVAKKIWDYFDLDIIKYVDQRKQKVEGKLGWQMEIPNKRKAFKEQKARGFIHINDFEDYNRNLAYLFSNVDHDYVLPIPFYVNTTEWTSGKFYCYHGQYLYGVPGWTRLQLPSWGKLGMAI